MTKMHDREARHGLKGEAERIGFFGKLPTHGDFISWGLTVDLQRTLDDWLQKGLQTVQESLGESWLRTFKTMPPWRFIIEEGLWSAQGVAGVVLPSRDRVGRGFPLVVLSHIQQAGEHPFQFYKDESWFTALEAIAESAVCGGFQLDDFTGALQRLRSPRPLDRLNDASRSNRSRMARESLWWTILPGSRKVQGFRNEGAPRKEDFLRLLQAGDAKASLAEVAVQPLQQAEVSPARYQAPPAEVMQSGLCWSSSYQTHAGTGGQLNADALLASDVTGLFAVADGVEDDENAAEAARLAVHLVGQAGMEGSLNQRLQELNGKLERANTLLKSRTECSQDKRVNAASLAALSLSGVAFSVIWAGDTRCYLLRDGMLRCLTRDHVEVGMRRSLSRGVGLASNFQMETVGEELRPQDRFLLCTAPLVRAVPERAIAEIMLSEAADDVPRILIETALISGCPGNMTALVAQITDC